jgi:hypothetical protein
MVGPCPAMICIPVTPLPVLLHDLLVLAVGGIKSFRRLLFLLVLVRIVSAKRLVLYYSRCWLS